MGIINALNNRPVRVLGFITAIHSFIYGIGCLTGAGGFSGTVLYVSFESMSSAILGYVLVGSGSLLIWAYIRNNPKTIRAASTVQTVAWLFATSLFIINGAWLLAIGTTLQWALISSYLGYAFGNRQSIIAYDQTPQARLDTINEDTL